MFNKLGLNEFLAHEKPEKGLLSFFIAFMTAVYCLSVFYALT